MTQRKSVEPIPLKRATRLIEEDIREGFLAGSDRWDSRILVSMPTGPYLTNPFGANDTVNVYTESIQRFGFNALYQDARIQQFGSKVMAVAQVKQPGE